MIYHDDRNQNIHQSIFCLSIPQLHSFWLTRVVVSRSGISPIFGRKPSGTKSTSWLSWVLRFFGNVCRRDQASSIFPTVEQNGPVAQAHLSSPINCDIIIRSIIMVIFRCHHRRRPQKQRCYRITYVRQVLAMGNWLWGRFTAKTVVDETLELATGDTLRIAFTTKEGGNAARPHQSFLLIEDPSTNLEISIPVPVKPSGKAKLDLVSQRHYQCWL